MLACRAARIAGQAAPRPRLASHCTCWCARRSNWTRRSSCAPASITLDYLDLYGLRPSVERVQAAGIAARVASPRVLKPGEERDRRFPARAATARSWCARPDCCDSPATHRAPAPLIGDFSLNAANVLTADEFFGPGARARSRPPTTSTPRRWPTWRARVGGDRIEVVAYQHLPVFHTEHCVFCRFLSTGTSYQDCGHPCEKHRVALRDVRRARAPGDGRRGLPQHRLRRRGAGGQPRTWKTGCAPASRTSAWSSCTNPRQQVTGVTRAFEQALAGRIDGRELMQKLQKLTPQGITQGSFFIPENYLTLPVLQ